MGHDFKMGNGETGKLKDIALDASNVATPFKEANKLCRVNMDKIKTIADIKAVLSLWTMHTGLIQAQAKGIEHLVDILDDAEASAVLINYDRSKDKGARP